MKQAFIFDLDGTLTDCTPRAKKYLVPGQEDYDSFYEHVEEDKRVYNICCIVWALNLAKYDILFVTGRRESARRATLKWIFDNLGPKYANPKHLFMRLPEHGHREDYVSKIRNYRDYIQGNWEILGVFEDRGSCVQAWRDLGLTCLQVANGEY